MQKRILVIALCIMMVSTFAATSEAAAASTSPIRQYDVHDTWQAQATVWGKLTVNFDTHKYVCNINAERGGWKDYAKTHDVGKSWTIKTNKPEYKEFGEVTFNAGGTGHGEGTLDDSTLAWLDANGANAWFFL